jgi:hypothetical protein
MSEINGSTLVYSLFDHRDAAQQDEIVMSVMRLYQARRVNAGTFLATNQRDNTFELPGFVDQILCRQLETELTKKLGQPVKVTTRFEDTDVGKMLHGAGSAVTVPHQLLAEQAGSPDPINPRQHMLDVLSAAGVAKVSINYDGAGDEGQIEEFEALDASGQVVDLEKMSVTGAALLSEGENTLYDLVEEWFYDAISESFAGWEVNEGSSGEIAIDVAAGTITCDHSERYIETHDTSVSL